MTFPTIPGAQADDSESQTPREELAPEDFYYEGEFLVFTAAVSLEARLLLAIRVAGTVVRGIRMTRSARIIQRPA